MAASLSRLLLNTARRFAYPFAPALSRGMGVPLTDITALIAANQITGVLSLIFGPLGDRRGYRIMLLLGLGSLAAGMLIGGFLPCYGGILAALFLAGLGKTIFDPAILAYAGERVPYHRRGLAIGIMEMSWAGSSLIGIPLVGLLIEGFGWRAPFFVLGGLAVLSLIVMGIMIPGNASRTPADSERRFLFRDAWQLLVRVPAARGALGFAFCISAASDNLFVVYGMWLESSFGLSITALGLSASVIGVAEWMGEGLTASLADRVGLRRSLITGMALSGLAYAVFPLTGQTFSLAMAGLFLVFLASEFTIVTSLSFFTEILPDARATMMSGYFAAASLGRVFGALIGGPVWMAEGIRGTGLVSACITALGLMALLWGIRNPQNPRHPEE